MLEWYNGLVQIIISEKPVIIAEIPIHELNFMYVIIPIKILINPNTQ